MHTFVMLAITLLAGDGDGALVQRLDADYQSLATQEVDPQPVREAARLLKETNRTTASRNYMEAVKILRVSRPKAGIPLLLKYAILHTDMGADENVKEYADTLRILTGEAIDLPRPTGRDRSGMVRESVQKLVDTWWEPNRDKITTRIGEMSVTQQRLVTQQFLAKVSNKKLSHPGIHDNSRQAYWADGHLREIFKFGVEGGTGWISEEIPPALIPSLLETAGSESPRKELVQVLPYKVIPLLTEMRRNGNAAVLDEIADDPRQSARTRLLAVLAIYSAGEEIKSKSLLAIAKAEQPFEIKVLTLLTMQYCAKPEIRRALTEFTKDANREIRTAAVIGLAAQASPESVGVMKNVIDHLDPPDAVHHALRTLGKMGDKEAMDALASFIEATLEDPTRERYLNSALSFFQSSSRYDAPREKGPHSAASRKDEARQVLAWWKMHKDSWGEK